MGPIVIISLGLSGAAASFVGKLGAYRQYFVILSVGLIGFAHYVHGNKKDPKRYETALLWIMTTITLVNVIFGPQLFVNLLS